VGEHQALATVRRFNAANGKAWFWLKIAAALPSKHHWLVIAGDACGRPRITALAQWPLV
jgi:hypothetical protein